MAGTSRARQVLEPLEPVQRVGRLDRDATDGARVLLQPPRGAHHRAARAEARDEVRDAVADRVEDLAPGAVVVRARVGGVRVLVGIEIRSGFASTSSRTTRIAPSEPSIGSL